MTVESVDFLIIGGGITGAAAACELAKHGTVVLAERETQLAYHTTGRSAAISMESYGNSAIRALTVWSTPILKNDNFEFSDHPVWAPRGALILADTNTEAKLDQRIGHVQALVPSARKVDQYEILSLAPYLRNDRWTAGIYEPNAFDLDVHAIHSSYVRGLTSRNGRILRRKELLKANYANGGWTAHFQDGTVLRCQCLVNAAGAWADDVAGRSGVATCGVLPLRRTVVLVDPGAQIPHSPYVGTVDEQIFIKPDTTGMMISPCDEALSEPCDTAPEEIDIAIAIDRFLEGTAFTHTRIVAKWAGLRTFLPDRTPVIGADPTNPNFVWFAAVGGYGIQTAPAMARLCAAAALHEDFPADICGNAFTASDLSPDRCRVLRSTQTSLDAVAELR
jgi:D-arginine dehydrogenase